MHPGITLFLTLLWAQLYAACVYSWRFGEYYSYGWYVPPLVALFFYRIRDRFHRPLEIKLPLPAVVVIAVLLFAVIFALRTLWHVDPRWTLPLWLQAGVVVGFTAWAVFRSGGPAALRRTLPILIFACSAIPLPTVFEHALVNNLTDSVIAAAAGLLALLGHQVEVLGDRISSPAGVVHVTEGCR